MSSNPKKPKSHNGDEEGFHSASEIDIISNLPDEIRLRILSFLPTKSAIATSVLSTKWKNLFPLIPSINLDFEDHGVVSDSSKKGLFIGFVDRVLTVVLKDVPGINSLRLRCGSDYQECYPRWFRAAKELNLGKLDVRFAPMEDSSTLLNAFSGCQSLSRLSFGGNNCVISFPKDGINLPNLKELWLQTPVFKSKKTFPWILKGCPVLERLTLHDCGSQRVKVLPICISSLQHLSVTAEIRYCTDAAFEIVLDTPNLESLTCSGCIIGCYYEGKKLDSLRKAYINCRPLPVRMGWNDLRPRKTKFQQKLEDLIMACPNLESLVLLKPSTGLYHSNPPLPPLYYLRLLELTGMDIYGWKQLPCILVNAPNLENLSIGGEFNQSCYESFRISLQEVFPKSFLLHVKQICFSRFDGEEDDIRLIEYFLQNAVVLEKMKIMVNIPWSWDIGEEISFWENLSKLPRQSKTCQIFWKWSWDMKWSILEYPILEFDCSSTGF